MKALNEATNSTGLYLVPTEFSNRLLALIQAKSTVYPDCDIRQMAGLTQYIPTVTAGTTAIWPSELGTVTAAQSAFGRITLTAKKVGALTEASSEVLEDNNVGVATHLVEQMGTDIALSIDAEIITGGGTNFWGLLNTASMLNAVDAAGNTALTHASGTASVLTASAITIKAISAAVYEILKDNHEHPDVSYWNPKTVGQVAALTDSSTRPVLNQETWGSPLLREGVVATVYGTKVKTTTQIPTNVSYGTSANCSASATDAIVARSKQFGIIGQRRGFIWKTDYVIETDKYQYQTTTRLAFAIKYGNAYCPIRAITDSGTES